MGVIIRGLGICLPEKILTNKELEKMVDTSDEWILTRTGIKERRIIDEKETTSDLACRSALAAIEDAKIKKSEISGIIVATISPDMIFPSTACVVQHKLDLKNCFAFDISAACTGFIYGLSIAESMIKSGNYDNILLITADSLSRFTDYKDRSTCVLFGDGSGSAIISKDNSNNGIKSIFISADGENSNLIHVPAGGSRMTASEYTVKNRLHYMKMEGNELFKKAVFGMIESSEKALEMAKIKSDNLKLLIPHQANMRIIKAVQKRLNLTDDKVFINIDKYGNMSASTVIVGLYEARKKGIIKKGDLIELVAFGSGLTWGASVIKM